jgi:hypothetical protein
MPREGQTAAAFNAARMPGARYTKSFNTLTSGFQAEAAGRGGDERVVQWLCGDDPAAKEVVAGLIEDAGFVPLDLGGTAGCAVMEAPRRPGGVYGEEYRLAGRSGAGGGGGRLRVAANVPSTPRSWLTWNPAGRSRCRPGRGGGRPTPAPTGSGA